MTFSQSSNQKISSSNQSPQQSSLQRPTPQKAREKCSIWGRLFVIPHDDPSLSSDTWSKVQPCKEYQLFGKEILITQPSSSFWVYLLGVLTTLLGLYFMATWADQVSRVLWGVALLLWGVGALIAGTSYQAFGYQLKCKGRPVVAWTSWWEVIYLIFQQVSINVMLVAVAYSCLSESSRFLSVIVAITVSVIYTIMIFFGALRPVKRLITFELMAQFCTPIILFLIGLNSWRYWHGNDVLDLVLLGTWLGLVATMWLYWRYDVSGMTQKLWTRERWFSENDVLHVALILWVFYIAYYVAPVISDNQL